MQTRFVFLAGLTCPELLKDSTLPGQVLLGHSVYSLPYILLLYKRQASCEAGGFMDEEQYSIFLSSHTKVNNKLLFS